jgi:carbamoyl-phosphate synthase small subunit
MYNIKALLALEDGRTFACRSFTGHGEASGEIVFNTSMTGYQEVLTDPSYRGQMVTMTYPLIGNYGTNAEDVESDRIQVSAFLIKEYQEYPSNFRSTGTLRDYLKKEGVLGIEDFDTRALTRHIRDKGAMRAYVSTHDLNPSSLVEKAKGVPSMVGLDLAGGVSTCKAYLWSEGRIHPCNLKKGKPESFLRRENKNRFRVAAFDFGIKYNILRCLENAGCETVVVPASTEASVIKEMAPDGIFLSNGPGDPEPVTYAIETVRNLLEYRPVFGICLGHQILGLALGGKTYKLKFGHRGSNQPVKNLQTGKVEITSQNHGFVVDIESLGKDIEKTHINLNDNTLEGFRHRELPLFAVQYHPEASPGPHDSRYLFNEFTRLMKNA